MFYFDNLLVNSIINLCERMGNLFLANYMGISNFSMGLFMWVLLIGMTVGFMGVKKHVR